MVDGTCPYVKYPQAMAQQLSGEGYHVVIVGDADHAEIKGVVSYAEGPCTVVKPGGPIPEIKAKKVAVIAQTTCIGAEFARVVGALALRHKEVRAVNTICNDTEERQADARALAREVDAVVVVGGKNSANTRHLAEICREHPAPHLARRDRGGAPARVVRGLPHGRPLGGRLDARLGGRGRRRLAARLR